MQPNVDTNERTINSIGKASKQASISMLNRLGVGETERVVDAMRPTSVSIRASVVANEHMVGTIESVAVQTSAWI